jgi:tRNA threonylcarbamoyladenosine biosynthesis protein TsaB
VRILGIDTATGSASAALVQDGEILADEVRPQPKAGHAEVILSLVQSVFVKTDTRFSDLDGIAVSIGPGSFTGLRVGLSTAKGLVYGRQSLPVAGISTLLANASRIAACDLLICSMLDARRKEVYASFFRRTSDRLARLTEDTLAPLDSIIDQARSLAASDSMVFIGEGAEFYRDALVASLKPQIRICVGAGYSSLAAAVARLGEHRLRHSEGDCLASLVPVYLRISEAERKRYQLS